MTFDSFDLHPALRRGIADLGFSTPTAIQQKAVPPGLEGRDLLACAMTGSGKTAAFLLPVLDRLLHRRRGATRALVLTPTRELAAQIVDHCNGLAKHTRLRAAAVFGGVGMRPQEQAFRRGVDILVACPGRLLDHFQYSYAHLDELEVLVLDEADRMLDMGFLPDIRRVLDHLPPRDQTMLFSATMPAPIAELSRRLLSDPVRLDVERPAAPATRIDQAVFPVRHDLKSSLLLALMEQENIDGVLVFTRTKHRADRLARFLDKKGVACDRIHGNRSQPQRTRALAEFKSGKLRVLVATDIAARGIDVEALSHVINFDVPNMPEDYIHRVGRTARAQASGEAYTFVSPQEKGDLRAIERALGKRLPRRTVDGFDHQAPAAEALEIPIKERIAAIRARKAEDRARARAKAERRAQQTGHRPGAAAGRRSSEPPRGDVSRPSRPAAAAAASSDRPSEGGRPRRRRNSRRRRSRPAHASRG